MADAAPSDESLLAAFAAGDARAFEQLYARHETALYRFVRRLLGRDAAGEVDEIFQDTWLGAIRARQGWQADHAAGATFRTWLFSIAHHRAIDRLRRLGREVVLETDEAEPWQPDAAASPAWSGWPAADGAGSPEDRALWRAAGRRLLDCLDELPAPQRAAFLMHHDDGLALAELATALGVGFETAKTRLRYAMSKLRRCMGAHLPAGDALALGEPPR